MSGTAFGKITAVYGQITEKYQFVRKMRFDYGQISKNGLFVRNWTAPKMAITDKMVKNGRLSVKIQAFRPWFYGQMVQKDGFVRKSSS